MAELNLLQDLAILLVAAGLAGWICQRIGLSSVVGFLLAGILIGPHTPPFVLVSDLQRIHTLSQLGLVFLMFFVGMGLSIRRLQQMGVAVLLATGIGAILVLISVRSVGLLIDWSPTQSLFLAALLMTSSSAIINKVLQETGSMHEAASRRALAITVLEDVVAVVMLTVLTSVTGTAGEGASSAPVVQTLALILLFVTVLVIAGLLLVPRLLGKLTRTADVDLQTILIAGMVLGVALLAVEAGYSLALGAFLLGAIVAVTPQRSQVERYLQGLRDIFTAIFFVSIGMLMDLKMVADHWLMVLLFGAFTLVLRSLVCSTSLILIGTPTRDAVRSGLMLTPIGEFSFIIAQLGVATGGAPKLIYPLAVGTSLFTAITAPLLIKHSASISRGVERVEPKFLKELVGLYHRALENLQQRQQGNVVWKLTERPLTQIALWFLFVTGVLAFSRSIYSALFTKFGADLPYPQMWNVAFWIVLGLLTLPPLFAIWRSLAALATIYAEAITKGLRQDPRTRMAVQTGLRMTFAFCVAIWLWLLLPLERTTISTVAAVVVLLCVLLLLLQRKLTRLHSAVELELTEALTAADERPARSYQELLQPHREWDIQVHEVVLPDHAKCAGKTLADLELRRQFGCSVAGMERHGYSIPNPPPDFVLYPGDKLLLLATAEQMPAVRNFLNATKPEEEITQILEEIEMEGVIVPESSPAAGKMLIELDIPAATGVQLVGIERDGHRLLNPGPFQSVEAGDRLLALGTHPQISAFERWLRSSRGETAA